MALPLARQQATIEDRGDREVTLRPEMTPSVARMVAGERQNLSFPLRWYSIPNLFRYEKPQRGRLREHWQLNVDLFGLDNSEADAEIITIAYNVMKKFGAQDSDFIIKLNSRKLLNDFYRHFSLTEEESQKVAKLIDKKNKIPEDVFVLSLAEVVSEKADEIVRVLSSSEKFLNIIGQNNTHADELVSLIEKLEKSGVKNIVFDPTLMRGFDYYTGVVFEVFDTHPENNRSVFGGGRYDDLLDIFDSPKVPAIGFGAGDVTARDFLESHNLIPTYSPSTQLYIATLEPKYFDNARSVAESIRAEGIHVSINITEKKVGDQIKMANKQKIPYVLAIGENEVTSNMYTLKHMETGTENKLTLSGIIELIKKTEK